MFTTGTIATKALQISSLNLQGFTRYDLRMVYAFFGWRVPTVYDLRMVYASLLYIPSGMMKLHTRLARNPPRQKAI